MSTRRSFIAQSSLGFVGAVAVRTALSTSASAAAPAVSAAALAPSAAPPAAAAAASATSPGTGVPSVADGPVLRWVPKHNELAYTFGGVAPRHRIQSGTRIITWTEDCFDGAIKTPADLVSKVTVPGHDNPQTGPFYVEGAQPGDTLAIKILKLEPARDYAISTFIPGFGIMVGNDRTAMLGPDLAETTWRYDVDAKRGVARTKSTDGKHSWEVPLAPFLGCLGVAPAGGEVRSTIVPDTFGGNMDCPEVRAGNTVYLGVNMPGGLLSFGDGHYAMGDGEIIGAAIEGAMNVDVVVTLIKGVKTPIPRIENEREVMFVGAARPLEDAARVAFKAMIGWVREKSGMSELDAYQFVSQNARAPVIQLVDPEYTVLVKIDKSRI
jgi:acetamidase/formamidase